MSIVHVSKDTLIEVLETVHEDDRRQYLLKYYPTGQKLGVLNARATEEGDLVISRHTLNSYGVEDGHQYLSLTKGEREMLTLWLAELSLMESGV